MSNDYHGRIMNLQIDPENVLDGWTRREFGAYKDGHRDARHNAAVIGNDADIELHAARARIAELEAECARLRGAMPDAALLDYAAGQLSVAGANVHIASSTADQYRDTEDALTHAAARIRAALATATPAPSAAEAGTGGEWTREAPKMGGEYWAVVSRWREPAPDCVILRVADGLVIDITDAVDQTYGYGLDQILLWGPGVDNTPPPGWREALAALDTPQEADHAAQ